MKKLIGDLLRRLGYEIHRIGKPPGVDQFLASRNVDFVFDVGANSGQFGRGLRRHGYRGAILSFEPVREVFAELQRRIADDANWRAHGLALGAERGRGTIHVSRASVFSSLVAQTEFAAGFDSAAQVVRDEEIEVACLDDFLPAIEGRRPFLKIDTQGFEQQVLAGARRVLETVEGVLLEVSLVNVYAGTWKLEEVLTFMRARGFVLAQVKPVNELTLHDGVSLAEIDCLFRRLGAEDEWAAERCLNHLPPCGGR